MGDGEKLNGLDVQELKSAFEAVASNPGASHAPKSSRVQWLGGLKLKARVRNHAFMIDEPTHLTGEDEAPNAMEYVLGALGACYATGFVLNATKRGITIRNLEVTLDATQDNVFTFLGLDDKGHPGFDGIKAKLYVQTNADEKTVKEIWRQTIDTSPVGNSLVREVPISTDVSIFP